MRLLVAVTSIMCLSFVRADSPADEVPIEKPRIVNPDIPPSQIVSRNDGNIVIVDDPTTPPPPPQPKSFPVQDSTSIIDKFSGEQLGVDAENFDKFLNDMIRTVKIEAEAQKNTTSSPDSVKVGTINNNVINDVEPLSLTDLINDAQLQFDQFSQSQLADSVIQNKPDPILEQSFSNNPNVPSDLNTGAVNGPISRFPDLSTDDNFDSDDAKRLVQLIEERRELLRQLKEQEQVVSNARGAPFRTAQRSSGGFDDFGILRSNIPPGLTPLVGNSIGVPVNTVTDSESQRNNRQTDLLADAGRVNAPDTIRQIFLDDDAGNPNIPSGVLGFGTRQVLSTDSFDDNLGPGLDDDFIQRRNALLAERQLLERQLLERQLASVSRQTLPIANRVTPLNIPSDLNSVPSLGRIPLGDFDHNFQAFGVNQNIGDDDFGSLGRRSQQTPLRHIPGLFSSDVGLANVLASGNRNPFLPAPNPTLRRSQQQDPLSGFSDNSVFRSPNSRVPSRDFLLRQFQRGFDARGLSSNLDDGSSAPETNLPRFPSPLGSIRPGSGIDLMQQTRNNLRIPEISSHWRPGSRDSIFSSSDDDEPLVQTRGSQFTGFSSSIDNLRPSRGFPELQNIPTRVPGVSSPLDNNRSNALNRNRNNPFFIPGVLPSFGVSTSDDDSSPVHARSNIGGFSGFSSSLNNIRRPGVLGSAPPQRLPFTDDDSSPGDVQSSNAWWARFSSPLHNVRQPGVLNQAPPQRVPMADDDFSSLGVRSNIRGNSGFSTSLNNIRPTGFVSPGTSQRSPLTGTFGTFNRPQVPLPPSAVLDDDDGSTRQNVRTDDGSVSQRSEEFPEFNRQVEQLLQGSFSQGSFNDDGNFQGSFSRRRFIPNAHSMRSFRQPHGSFLLRQRSIF